MRVAMADVCRLYQRSGLLAVSGVSIGGHWRRVAPLAYRQESVHMQSLLSCSPLDCLNWRWVDGRLAAGRGIGLVGRSPHEGSRYRVVVGDSRVAVQQWTRSTMPSTRLRDVKRSALGDGSWSPVECSVSCFTPFSGATQKECIVRCRSRWRRTSV